MKERNFDYSSFAQPVSLVEVGPFQLLSAAKVALLLLVITITLWVTGAIMLHTAGADGRASTLAAVIIAGAICYLALFAVYGKDIRVGKQIAKTIRFAYYNNLAYDYALKNPGYAGMMFTVGNSRKIVAAIGFSDAKAVYEIGNYSYAMGYGNGGERFHYGYIRILQQRRLPHVALVSTRHKRSGPFRNMAINFGKQQKLGLEGNFDNYFTVYAPEHYEADVLYILTPDVMASLIDNTAGYDIEIVDDELYIYRDQPFDLTTEAGLKQALCICDTVGAEIDHQTDYYADQKVDNRSLNRVTRQGYRLRQVPSILMAGYLVYVAAVVGLIVHDPKVISESPAGAASGLLASFGFLYGTAERLQRLKQNRKDRTGK